MFRSSIAIALTLALLPVGCATGSQTDETAGKTPTRASQKGDHNKVHRGLSPHDAVVATELAFARTMADRDFKAFRSFLSDEAIFMSGERPVRGKERVAAAWQGYFETVEAPFSWVPAQVIVMESTGLAFSTGPVSNPDGVEIGTFNSVWRLEPDGIWRIVFDKGGCACD